MFFPYEWFDHPDEMQNTETHPCGAFYSKLRCCNALEAKRNNYIHLLKNEMTTEKVVIKLILSKPPPTRVENYQNLQQSWKQQQISSFEDFWRW